VSGRKLRALARRHGCRTKRSRDGHYKFFAPDGELLGKLKAGNPTDTGYYRQDLAKRIQAYPVVKRAPTPPAVVIPPMPAVADAPPALDVVPPPQPLNWQAWTAQEPRQGTRATRRRRWQSEIRDSWPEAS
jgi:hypothetical protein